MECHHRLFLRHGTCRELTDKLSNPQTKQTSSFLTQTWKSTLNATHHKDLGIPWNPQHIWRPVGWTHAPGHRASTKLLLCLRLRYHIVCILYSPRVQEWCWDGNHKDRHRVSSVHSSDIAHCPAGGHSAPESPEPLEWIFWRRPRISFWKQDKMWTAKPTFNSSHNPFMQVFSLLASAWLV